jgi:hypothetical protein
VADSATEGASIMRKLIAVAVLALGMAPASGPSIVRDEGPRAAGIWCKTGQGQQQAGIVGEFGVGGYFAVFSERGGPALIAIGEQGIQVNASGEPDAGAHDVAGRVRRDGQLVS